MERLKKVSLYICNLNQEEALHHMVMTLRLGPFVDNICKKLVEELDELWRKAAKFIQLREL